MEGKPAPRILSILPIIQEPGDLEDEQLQQAGGQGEDGGEEGLKGWRWRVQ